MPSTQTLLAFAVAAVVLVAVPGPSFVLIAARSATAGRRVGIATGVGIETGTLVHVLAAAGGLSAVLMASSHGFAVVKYAGAAYLAFLGVRTLLGRGTSRRAETSAVVDHERTSWGRGYRQAVLVQVLNPKVAIFFLALLPQFLDASRPTLPQVAALGMVLSGIGLTANVLVALTAAAVTGRARSRRSAGRPWGRWVTGGTYVGLAAYAAAGPTPRSG